MMLTTSNQANWNQLGTAMLVSMTITVQYSSAQVLATVHHRDDIAIWILRYVQVSLYTTCG